MTRISTPVMTTFPPAHRQRSAFGALLMTYRVMATLHGLCALAQPVWIGQYLNGRYTRLELHSLTGTALLLSAMLLGAVTVAYVVAGGRAWALLAVLFFLTEGLQTGMGYSRDLAIHVPLGVAIAGLAVFLAVWVWTPGASRRRPARRSGVAA